jgi:glycosyltransferase involved in cell wall biosynthesis
MAGEDDAVTYSFVVPIYNDGYLAEDFCREFERVLLQYLGVEQLAGLVEVIFVNDGSKDDSFAILAEKVCPRFSFVRAIDLSRNFGQHIAITCGYRYAKGDIVGYLNVDMEDAPDQLPLLLDQIRTGRFDFVGGLYNKRRVPLFNKITSKLFARLLNLFTGYALPLNMATMRVMNRRFIDVYNQLTEKSRYLPGIEAWMGFRRGWVPIAHRRRERGASSYNFKRRLLMASESIISFSDLPLKMAVVLGTSVAFLGLVMTGLLVISKLFFIDFRAGYTTTVSIIVFMGGVQIGVMGLASLYIGRILREVQNRPLFIVRETRNL